MHISFFEALADPNRLHIVEALREGERSVGELVDRVDIHQSGVSRHLRVLHAAGLVQARADGARRLYSLRPEPFRELQAWTDGYRRLWGGRLDRLERALDEKQRRRRSPGVP